MEESLNVTHLANRISSHKVIYHRLVPSKRKINTQKKKKTHVKVHTSQSVIDSGTILSPYPRLKYANYPQQSIFIRAEC